MIRVTATRVYYSVALGIIGTLMTWLVISPGFFVLGNSYIYPYLFQNEPDVLIGPTLTTTREDSASYGTCIFSSPFPDLRGWPVPYLRHEVICHGEAQTLSLLAIIIDVTVLSLVAFAIMTTWLIVRRKVTPRP